MNRVTAVYRKYPVESWLVGIGLLFLTLLFALQWIALHSYDATPVHGHIPTQQNFVRMIGVPLDDVYIHCRYAQNLIAGSGFSFNPGEQVTADTSPLWVILLTVSALFTTHLEVAAILWSALFYLILAPGVYRISRDIFELPEIWSRLAGILTVICSRLIWSSASGMEVTLASLLVLLSVEEHERGKRRGAPRWREAIWLGLGYNARPEVLLLIMLLLGDWLLIAFRTTAVRKGVLRNIIVALILVLPYPLLSYHLNGSFVSHSSIVQGARLSWRPDLYYLFYSASIYATNNIIEFLLAVVAVVSLWSERRWKLAILFVVGLPILQAFIAPAYRHHGRYLFPAFTLLAMMACAAGWKLTRRPRFARFEMGVILFCCVIGLVEAFRWSTLEANAVRNINDQHLAACSWASSNLATSDKLAVDDVGALGYFLERPLIDLTGLVSPAIWKLQKDQDAVWNAARAQGANVFIIYNRLNRPFYEQHRDTLTLVHDFTVRLPLIASADTTMSVYRIRKEAASAP